MITGQGQITGQDISPLCNKIVITTHVGEGNQINSTLRYQNTANYLVQNGVRTATIGDSIKGVSGVYSLSIADMEQEDAVKLDEILTKYFDKKANEEIAAQEAKAQEPQTPA